MPLFYLVEGIKGAMELVNQFKQYLKDFNTRQGPSLKEVINP